MRQLLCVIIILLFWIGCLNAQNITGLWQPRFKDCIYSFSSNGTFHFNPNPKNGIMRLLEIGGHYKIVKGKIVLEIEYTVERVGGTIDRDKKMAISNGWVIEGGQIKKILIEKPYNEEIEFTMGEGKIYTKDGEEYHKISQESK